MRPKSEQALRNAISNIERTVVRCTKLRCPVCKRLRAYVKKELTKLVQLTGGW